MQHKELQAGRWQTLTLAEQLGNVGSEVHRALISQGKSDVDFQAAFARALELFDLTIADPRHRERLKELTRAREIFCDAADAGNAYHTTLTDMDAYLMHFAVAAQNKR